MAITRSCTACTSLWWLPGEGDARGGALTRRGCTPGEFTQLNPDIADQLLHGLRVQGAWPEMMRLVARELRYEDRHAVRIEPQEYRTIDSPHGYKSSPSCATPPSARCAAGGGAPPAHPRACLGLGECACGGAGAAHIAAGASSARSLGKIGPILPTGEVRR